LFNTGTAERVTPAGKNLIFTARTCPTDHLGIQ
jgi:hypothetical protein